MVEVRSSTRRFHQTLHTLATDMDPFIGKFSVDAWGTLNFPGRLMDRLDASLQFRIGNGTGRWSALTPRVEPAAGNTGCLCHQLNREHGPVRRHEFVDREGVTPP